MSHGTYDLLAGGVMLILVGKIWIMYNLVVQSVLTPNTLCTSWFEGRVSGPRQGLSRSRSAVDPLQTGRSFVAVAGEGGASFSFLLEKAVINPTALTRLCGTEFSLHYLGNGILFCSLQLEASTL
jgi:hypothetical protein